MLTTPYNVADDLESSIIESHAPTCMEEVHEDHIWHATCPNEELSRMGKACCEDGISKCGLSEPSRFVLIGETEDVTEVLDQGHVYLVREPGLPPAGLVVACDNPTENNEVLALQCCNAEDRCSATSTCSEQTWWFRNDDRTLSPKNARHLVLGFGETTVNLCAPGQGAPSEWNSEMTLVSSSSSNRLVMNFCSGKVLTHKSSSTIPHKLIRS